MKAKIEVVKYQGRWEVRIDVDFGKQGYEEVLRFRWQFQAWLVARVRARRLYYKGARSVELIVKGRDGTIKRKDTYGYDPEETHG